MIRPLDFKNWNEDWNDVRWGWALLAGIAVSLATVVTIASIIAAYSGYIFAINPSQLVENSAQIERFAAPVSNIGSLLAQLAFTVLFAAWLVRKVGTAVYLHGFVLGVLSGVGILVQIAIFSQNIFNILNPLVLGTAFPLLILAGHIGARWGNVYVSNQRQLYNTSQAVQQARTPQEIVNAIGHNLDRPHIVHVGLWAVLLQDAQQRPTAVSPITQWSSYHASTADIVAHLSQAHLPQLEKLQPTRPLLVKGENSGIETAVWQMLSVHSLLILPLVTPSGNWLGLLTLGSRANNGFARDAEQDYVPISSQVALVLENLHLLEQAKEGGKLHERQRMAQEIHDTLAQGFTSIVMHLEAAEQALPSQPDVTQHHLTQAKKTARHSLGQARRVVDDLRPEILESAPLHEAIARVVRNWETQSGISTHFEATGKNENLHPQVEVTLLRGVQEALANVRKHAQATAVSVTLSYLPDTVILDVADDGVGMEKREERREKREERKEVGTGSSRPSLRTETTPTSKGGFGLIAMRQRVAALNGTVTIESEPNQGTTIAITIPTGSNYEQ